MADLRARIIISASDETRAGFNSVRDGLGDLNRQLTQARNVLLGFFGLSFSANFVKQLIETADEYKNLQAAIKLSTESQEEFDTASTKLFEIAQRTSTGLRENVDLYRRVSGAVRDLGGSQERALNLTELVGKAMALSGTSAEASANGVQQFNQGLASGVLRGQEFNSVMENTPRLAQALADGLNSTKGELRAMAEQGKLTTHTVLAALESQSDALNAEFAKLPPTVERAMVRVRNAFTVVIGQIDSGKGATASLAQGLNAAADNMRALIEAGLTLAKVLAIVYAAKAVQGIQAYVAAQYQAIAAQREAAASSRLLMEQAVRRAQVAAASSLNLIKEAQLQRRLAATETERALALRALDAAYKKHEANIAILQAQQTALNQSLRQGTLSALLFGDAVGVASRAAALMNNALGLFIAWEIGTTIGEWLRQFDLFRMAGTYLAEGFTLVVTGFQAMLDGLSIEERFAQVREIHAQYDALRASYTSGEAQAADARAEAEEQAAERQQAVWKLVEGGLKSLTASIESETALQSAAITQALDERLALIEASNAGEQQKAAERTEALIASANDELTLAKNTADAKLQLVYQAYGAQIQSIGKYNETASTLDRESIEQRKSIYGELATRYQAVVNQLQEEHQREVQAALGAARQIRDLSLQHQFDLADIERQGVSERKKVKSEENEFDKIMFELQKVRTGKKKASEQEINGLLDRAKKLHQDITQSSISLAKTESEKSSVRWEAQNRLNKIYNTQKGILADNQKAHEDNAKEIAAAQQDALAKLQDVNTKVSDITTLLNQQYALQIAADTSSIDAAIAKINSIPTEKTVVIKTISQAITAAGDAGWYEGAEGHANGGLIQRFASGGYPRRQGHLPGYGGGDKVPALLEAGEYIVRKEAVARLGLPTLRLVNTGQLPILRASGGPVPDWKKQLLANLLDPRNLTILGGMTGGLGTGDGDDYGAARRAQAIVAKELRENGLSEFKDQVFEIIDNLFIRKLDKPRAIEEKQRQFVALREQFLQSLNTAAADLTQPLKTKLKAPQLTIKAPAPPALDFPPLPGPAPVAPAAPAAAAKTVHVVFSGPGTGSVTGTFDPSGVEQLFQVLKAAGMRSTGGSF
jgi:tape measure domain-containing protein